jgi:16S rRNA G1207 methylase RsmC
MTEFAAERHYPVPGLPGPVLALPNVFSRDRLDNGSRFLLQHLDTLAPVDHAIDLACGSGVLGLSLLAAGLCRQITFCDESSMAIASARHNVETLFPDRVAATAFHFGDGLLGLEEKVALVICNPPFHHGHSVDDFAGRRLLQQAAKQLLPGGRLYLVANSHLPYGPLLRKLLGGVEQPARNRKFTLWLGRQR